MGITVKRFDAESANRIHILNDVIEYTAKPNKKQKQRFKPGERTRVKNNLRRRNKTTAGEYTTTYLKTYWELSDRMIELFPDEMKTIYIAEYKTLDGGYKTFEIMTVDFRKRIL